MGALCCYMPASSTARNRPADQVSSIEICDMGRRPASIFRSQMVSRLRSESIFELRLGQETQSKPSNLIESTAMVLS